MIDIEKLIEWLGPDGAIAGLDGSDLTVPELHDLAVFFGSVVSKKMKRSDIINEIVNRKIVKIEKTTDELLAMNSERLKKYFETRMVSTTELLGLLSQFDIHPKGDVWKDLADFAAREISDLGMFQRVAKGRKR